MEEKPFGKLLEELCGADLDEIIDSVNESELKEIAERPHFKLNDDYYYTKNAYEYFKNPRIHYLNPDKKFPKSKFNIKIASFEVLNKLKSIPDLELVILTFDEYIGYETRIKEFLVKNKLINESDFKPTINGEKYLEKYHWIDNYKTYLDSFDFDEFEECLKNSDFNTASLNFLNKHLKVAFKRKDYKAYFDSQLSKALYYIVNGDYNTGLKEEITLFQIRLNPICDKSQLVFHEPINQVNISNLKALINVCEIDDIEKLFNECWDSVNYNAIYINRNDAYNYLVKALENHSLDNLNSNAEETYFK